MKINQKVLDDARRAMKKERDEGKEVMPAEHLMFKEKCFQLFEQQIPKLEHRTKRLTAIVEEVSKLGMHYPMYQFYLALACASDDMLVGMRERLMAELEQKAAKAKVN